VGPFSDQVSPCQTSGYAQVIELRRKVPTDARAAPTVIWVDNYGGDFDCYDAPQLLAYVAGGGNFILATRLGSNYLTTTIRQCCGIATV
jgi:hypothetical protein